MPSVVKVVVESMAMPFAIEVVGAGDPAEARQAIQEVHDDLDWAESVFSLWRPDSPMSRLARGELEVEGCPPAVAEVLHKCERFQVETDGFFDARRPDGTLDPTGIVKAWAVVRASRHLDALGAAGWMVGASGDVLCRGVSGDLEPWAVGIADPRLADNPEADPQAGPVLDVVTLGGAPDSGLDAMATSGTAHHGEHVWNPKTGERQASYIQVSVIGRDLVQCDAWATAIVAGGAEVAHTAQGQGLEVLCLPAVGGKGADTGDGPVMAEVSPGWPGGRHTP